MDIGSFTGHAGDYSNYRNAYPQAFIEHLYEKAGFTDSTVIADIGSGTGILSRQLLSKGSKVLCVEPNQDMRAAAEQNLSGYNGFHSVNGTAEKTALDTGSVDFVTVGTAFHWFDETAFKAECRRILKPGGKVVLVWNSRPVNRNAGAFVINFDGISGGKEEHPELFKSFYKDGTFEHVIFKETIFYDKQRFIGRALTSFRSSQGILRFRSCQPCLTGTASTACWPYLFSQEASLARFSLLQ
jgi:ubiquinone/menaquinone biosynthesis C-methylase UbiE